MIILNKNTYYRQSTYRGREKNNNTDLLHQIYEKTNLFNMWRKHDVH